MSYTFYKFVHLVGLISLFLSLGAALMQVYSADFGKEKRRRRAIGWIHGFALVFLLVSGFGLLARLQIHWPWPGYIWVKLSVWLILGGLLTFIYRRLLSTPIVTALLIGLGSIAAYMALWKPF